MPRVLITGASKGIGRALAAELAATVSIDAGMITVDEVATAAADVIDRRDPRLRVPIGAMAGVLLDPGAPA